MRLTVTHDPMTNSQRYAVSGDDGAEVFATTVPGSFFLLLEPAGCAADVREAVAQRMADEGAAPDVVRFVRSLPVEGQHGRP